MLVAMEGSVGYGIGGARVELEVGYERFKIKGNRGTGSNKEEDSDAVYLLAKELAYDVLNTRTSDLKTALAKTKGVDIVRFATEIDTHHPDIDKKLCRTGNGSAKHGGDGKCDDARNANDKYGLKSAMGDRGAGKWPLIGGNGYVSDATGQISKEMAGFNTEEKGITAGLFARTVEGGEVVEIRAISSTSVMINACYDMFSEGIGIVP